MSITHKRRSRSTIFEAENETLQEPSSKSVTRLPAEIFGVPLVDHDLPGDEVSSILNAELQSGDELYNLSFVRSN